MPASAIGPVSLKSGGPWQRRPPQLPLVRPQPLADRVVGHAVLAADRDVARLLDLPAKLLVERPLDLAAGRPGTARPGVPGPAITRAITLLGPSPREVLPAPRTVDLHHVPRDVPPAMRVERRRAVRAHDLQVLEAFVGGDPVAVIEDQGHSPPLPDLVLSADLAAPLLAAFEVETPFERAAVVGGAVDQDLGKGLGVVAATPPAVLVEVVRGNAPDVLRVALKRLPVAAGRSHAEPSERFRPRERRGDRNPCGVLRVAWWHEHMFASRPDVRVKLGGRDSNPRSADQNRMSCQLDDPPLAIGHGGRRGRYYDARVPAPTVVILAAGEGTRMRSSLPKVLHPLCGRPLIAWPIAAAREAGAGKIVVVDGPERRLEEHVPEGVVVSVQAEPRGTGDAVGAAASEIAEGDTVVVVMGDVPLVDAATLTGLVEAHKASGAAATMLTAELDDPTGYGRVVRDAEGQVERVVETKAAGDASEAELAIREVNTGIFAFDGGSLLDALEGLESGNAQGELYLPDVLPRMHDAGREIGAHVASDWTVTLGINDRVDLARVRAIAQQRINEAHMRAGVTLVDPASAAIDATVEIGADTVVTVSAP